jgi:hypothetical protein
VESEPKSYLAQLRLNRAQAFQVIAIGLLLAVGVNLIAVYLGAKLGEPSTLWAGVGATILGVLVIFSGVLRPRPRIRQFNGFFIFDSRENQLVVHDFEYELGSALHRYLGSAFAENESMKAIWDRNPLFDPSGHGENRKSLELVRQATEYFVLEKLSTRVSDHFRTRDFSRDELDSLSHEDIPDVLMSNRLLSLFAEPMEDRAAFHSEDSQADKEGWTTIMANAPSGALYSRFELVLPRGWTVQRLSRRSIEFNAKRFTLTITTQCSGSGEILPFGYISDYLGLEDPDPDEIRFHAQKVSVEIRIAPRRAWLVGPKGWRYYRWIDDWVTDLEPQIDQQAYLDRIGYSTAETVLKLLRVWRQRSRRSPDAMNRARVEIAQGTPGEYEHPDWLGIASSFSSGDTVEHAKFGRGTVIDVQENIVTVTFASDGSTRKLLFSSPPQICQC